MSQHILKTKDAEGKPITVVMGYDRPLDYVFCLVQSQDDLLYSSLTDENAGITQQDVEYYRPILATAGVNVPETMFKAVKEDQRIRAEGNKVAHYGG